MTAQKILLWLSLVDKLGARRIAAILNKFEDIEDIWTAPRERFTDIPSLTGPVIDAITASRDEAKIDAYIKKLNELKISFVCVKDDNYPALLKTIHDPPAVLYYLGELPDNAKKTVSIIGSRRCSEYGLIVSRKMSRDLTARGVIIVSGMAKGIDSSAHIGAISAGGKTVAVLGCGVNICYPAENTALRDKIIKNGCAVSEYPPGTKPYHTNFPERNRIISGLSQAVVVVEAATKSGTLITANMALEQGREVLAVPGNVTSALSAGTNNLIYQGAVPARDYKDILYAIGMKDIKDVTPEKKQDAAQLTIAPDEKLVYDCINLEPASSEMIAEKTNLPVTAITLICMKLEIKGLIKKMPGQRYIRI